MKYFILLLLVAGLFCCQSSQKKQFGHVLALGKTYQDRPTEGNAMLLDSAIKAFTALYPHDTAAPKLLFQDAEIHLQTLNNPVQAVAILKQIFTDYPESRFAPLALFSYGFQHEQLGNESEARKAYTLFLQKYPQHPLADDAKFSLETLGKDLNEVIREKQADTSAAK